MSVYLANLLGVALARMPRCACHHNSRPPAAATSEGARVAWCVASAMSWVADR